MKEGVVPEFVKVRAQRGFRAWVEGRFTVVNPGDVVTVPKETAIDLRMSQKAVMTDESAKIQSNFLPERKRKAIEEKDRERKKSATAEK